MCEILTLPHLPSNCASLPKHTVKMTMYFTCDEITKHPECGRRHCKRADCKPYGVFGSWRSKGECAYCIAAWSKKRVVLVSLAYLLFAVWFLLWVVLIWSW